MVKEGTIYLLDPVGEKLDSKRYHTPSQRNLIIGRWKMLYAASFRQCHIQISPEVNAELVSDNGANLKRHKVRGVDGKYISAMPTANNLKH